MNKPITGWERCNCALHFGEDCHFVRVPHDGVEIGSARLGARWRIRIDGRLVPCRSFKTSKAAALAADRSYARESVSASQVDSTPQIVDLFGALKRSLEK